MEIDEVDVFFPRPHALIVDPLGERFFSASLGQNSVAYAPLGAEEVDLLSLQGDMQMLGADSPLAAPVRGQGNRHVHGP